MIPGRPRILTCPHCGGNKKVMTLISGNNRGAVYWSDCKTEAPMLPEVSPIQKCPQCGKYYMLHKQEVKLSEDKNLWSSFVLGILTFEESQEALEQLLSEGLDKEEEICVRINLVHTFNDKFYRISKDEVYQRLGEDELCRNISSLDEIYSRILDDKPKPSEQAQRAFKDNALRLIDLLTDDESTIFKAELYREIGAFAECEKTLREAKEAPKGEMSVTTMILERCKKSDTKLFPLNPVF